MTAERAERRLMAVLAADVAGYSRLVGADEEGSLVQWRAHWHALIQIVPTLHPPKPGLHRGRLHPPEPAAGV